MPGPTIQDVLDRLNALEFTRREYHNSGDTLGNTIRGDNWKGQTFTPQNSHSISYVKLKFYRTGSPGTITVSIRVTDVEGKPTGTDLCSGTIDGDSLGSSSPGEWHVISFELDTFLDKNTKYAIVVRVIDGDSSNFIFWRQQGSGTYNSGQAASSTDGGVTWSLSPADNMFEEFENRISTGVFLVDKIDSKLPEAMTG